MQELSESAPQPRRGPLWFKRAAGLLVGVLLGVWFLVPAETIDAPVHLERDSDGQLHEVSEEAEGDAGLNFAAHAGALNSNNSTSSTTSSSYTNPAWFSCRSLMIINRSDHLLMNRVGQELLEQLKQNEQLDRIEYIPFDHVVGHGALSPDVVVTLNLLSITESGVVGRDLDASVVAEMGTAFTASNHSVSDNSSPPFVRFNSRIQVDHQSSFTGFESSAAKYVLQGRDIAKQLNDSLTKQLKGFREKHDPPPRMPKEFVPAYREPPEFEFRTQQKLQELVSFHGFMIHNETFWKLDETDDVLPALTGIYQELHDAGWKGSDGQLDEPSPYLYLTEGEQVIEIFREGRGRSTGKSDEPMPVVVRYRDRMNRSELHAIYQGMLDVESPDMDLLVLLHRFGSGEHRKRLLALVESDPPRSPDAWLELAGLYASRKNNDALLRALNRAHILSLTQADPSRHQSRIKSLVKKHKLDEKIVRHVDESDFDDLGFLRIAPDTPKGRFEIRSGGAAEFYLPGIDDDPWRVVAVRVNAVGASAYEIVTIRADNHGGRSRGSVSGVSLESPDISRMSFNGRRLTIRVEKTGDDLFLVTTESDPPKPGN